MSDLDGTDFQIHGYCGQAAFVYVLVSLCGGCSFEWAQGQLLSTTGKAMYNRFMLTAY